MYEDSGGLGRVFGLEEVEEKTKLNVFFSLKRGSSDLRGSFPDTLGPLTPAFLVIGQPAVYPMCVKGLCFLTVLTGLAASGETT